jgi:alginate O-acetyltransferase complex protein AlgI
MSFDSIQFLVFFPIVIALYFIIPFKKRWILLLIASYYFYMCWRVDYIILIMISTIIDYICSNQMSKINLKQKRKKWLIISLISNLGILFGFKYFNFFSEEIQILFNHYNIFYEVPFFNVLLPVGISFYTFQTLSYTIDVYNNKTPAQKHLGVFAVYVSFFPQLVAGPIERSNHLLPQFFKEHKFSYDRVKSGLQKMLWGFFKKLVIANNLAILVNGVYNNVDNYTGAALLVATIFFTFQIYCDFSGYSDIAIGTARVMGFELRENFKRPYFSKSIQEFWQRWHITLSSWFKDYLYIPLGGNRVVKWKWYYNIIITFLLSGLWHGAEWTFIIWGALHGIYLVFSITLNSPKKYLSEIIRKYSPKLNNIFDVTITFILVAFAWIFFRANNLDDALYVIKNMLTDLNEYNNIGMQFRGLGIYLSDLIKCFILIFFVIGYSLYERSDDVWKKLQSKPIWIRWSLYYLMLFGILFLAPHSTINNFIYFQF